MTQVITIGFFLLGAVLASFTGVIVERVYTGQSWLQGRSRCNSCRRTLSAPDLVPVFSWIFFRGRCRSCQAHVPGLYALYEAITGTVFALSYWKLGLTLSLAFFFIEIVVLLFIVMYDLRHTIVPWGSTLALLIPAVFFAIAHYLPSQYGIITLVAAVIGVGFFSLYFLSGGRAMGLGDAPVAFTLSLLVGSAAFSGLLFSFWIGAVVGILILVFRRGGPKMGIEIPFVPFLALGYLLAFFTQWIHSSITLLSRYY